MAKYRKKPVIVDVVGQWDETINPDFYEAVFWDTYSKRFYVITIHSQKAYIEKGDWIIAEPDGKHYYPCRPDIFAQAYEAVDERPD